VAHAVGELVERDDPAGDVVAEEGDGPFPLGVVDPDDGQFVSHGSSFLVARE
jgi:hypothetical protein